MRVDTHAVNWRLSTLKLSPDDAVGGVEFIGRPKQPSLTVCQLARQDYEKRVYRLGDAIASRQFPDLRLCRDDLR